MNQNTLLQNLSTMNLMVNIIADDCWAITHRNFANPLLHFNPRLNEKEYRGNVTVKSINVPLYSHEQVHKSIHLVDTFLQTPLSDREITIEKAIFH